MDWSSAIHLKKKRAKDSEDEEYVSERKRRGAVHAKTGPAKRMSVAEFFKMSTENPEKPIKAKVELESEKDANAQVSNKVKAGKLLGKTLVFTGNMSIDREAAIDLAVAAGGKVTSAVSGKTSYLVVGSVLEDGRPVEEGSKFRKMVQLASEGKPGPAKLTESEFLSLVGGGLPLLEEKEVPIVSHKVQGSNVPSLWVDKYEPQTIAEFIGNSSSMNKLVDWLARWKKFGSMDGKSVGFGQGNPNARACLLSGSPGVGKSLAARLACAHAGLQIVEYNASDYRNKAHMDVLGSSLIGNRTFASSHALADSRATCLVMDEVDGMSSGDRGGGAALIQLIKKTKIPIICICNDRMNPKIRSLANYCFDLRFSKPPKNMLVKRAIGILKAEGVDADIALVEQVVDGADCDVRQTINQLQALSATSANGGALAKKDRSCMLTGFEAARLLLASDGASLNDKLDLFFVDYELIPLLIQQNYLKCFPATKPCGKEHVLSAACLSFGDQISQCIRSEQNWGLLPEFGLIGCVFVPPKMAQGMSPFPEFPMWFGKYSHGRKIARIIQELRCVVGGSSTVSCRNILISNYAYTLYKRLVAELCACVQNGGELPILDALGVAKNDLLEMLTELRLPWQPDTFSESTDAKTKAAITRICNAHHTMLKTGGAHFRSIKAAPTEHVKFADEREPSEDDDEEANTPVEPKTKDAESLIKPAKISTKKTAKRPDKKNSR